MKNRYIYFIRPVGMDGPIKIGISDAPVRRLRGLMAWSPVALELLATFPGTKTEEAMLHSHFLDQRDHGEWFKSSPSMLDLIARIHAGEPLSDIIDMTAQRRPMPVSVKVPGKQSVSVRVVFAEKRAFGPYPTQPPRPAHIAKLLNEWQAAFDTTGMAFHRSVLLAYADDLKKHPPHPRYLAERAKYGKPYSVKRRAQPEPAKSEAA